MMKVELNFKPCTARTGSSKPGLVNGHVKLAQFCEPSGIAAVPSTHTLVVADAGNHCIRLIDIHGMVSTLAGSGVPGFLDGHGQDAQLHAPNDIVVCSTERVWVADTGNHRLRVIDSEGNVQTPDIEQALVAPCRLAWRAPDVLVAVEEAPDSEVLRCFKVSYVQPSA